MSNTGRLRIGIIGAARVAVYAMVAPAKDNPRVELAGIAARDPARAQAFAAEHGVGHSYASYDALIGDPSVDLVYVATPPSVHAAVAIKALEAGKHVLVEKPFALDASEARAILTAAQRTGRRVFEAFHYRHHALWHRIVTLVRSGEIGEVKTIDAAFHVPIPRTADEFRWNASLGGGALMDLGCYPLQWARVVAGEEPTVKSARMRMIDGVDVETEAQLAFPSGVQARVSCRMDGDGVAATLSVVGSRGALRIINPLAPQMGHVLEIQAHGADRKEVAEGPSTFGGQGRALGRHGVSTRGRRSAQVDDGNRCRARSCALGFPDHLQGVGQDFAVVEGQFLAAPVGDEFGGMGVVACLWCSVSHLYQERHGNGVTARVTLWVGINSNETLRFAFESGLFAQFSHCGRFNGFAVFDEAAR